MSSDVSKFDREIIENLRDVLGDRLSKVIHVYLAEVPKSVKEMRNANENRDFKTAMIIAHALKSSSANVGAMQVAHLAANLELKLKQKDVDNVTEDINNLQQAFDQVRPMFSEFI